jgi:hypothetical protein
VYYKNKEQKMKKLILCMFLVLCLCFPAYAHRMAAGEVNQYIYFVAVDSTDLKTRETGFSSFTVYYSINSGSGTAMTTPTIAETDSSNMPGVYDLLIDEAGMTTLTAGDDTAELCLHITHAGMDPVTRVIEIYRPETTLGQTLTVASGIAEANLEEIENDNQSSVDLKDFADAGYDPANDGTNVYTVRGAAPKDSAAIATDVLNAATASYGGAGTYGQAIEDTVSYTALNNAFWNVFVLTSGTLGATGNDTTHLHLTGQGYANDDLNDYLIVLYDNSGTKYYSQWITNWVLSSALATTTTWPITPEASVDQYWIFNIKKDPGATDLEKTTIESLASQTSFTLALPASSDDTAYAGSTLIIRNDANDVQTCQGVVDTYTGATRTVTLQDDPGIFTMGVGDVVTIIPLPEVTATVAITQTVGEAIADYVRSEPVTDSETADTIGYLLWLLKQLGLR